jgi:polysaccharide biosynthesis PFTS motif protein
MPVFNFYTRRQKSKILKSSRGYEKLKNKNKLEFIDEIKTILSNSNLFENKPSSFLSFLNIHSNDINIEISARQFILGRYVGSTFTREILKSISDVNEKFCSPLPYVWLKVLSKSGIRVNYFNSILLWYIELLKHFLYGLLELIKQFKYYILSNFERNFDYSSSFVYFDSLTISNLPTENTTNKYGILTWYYDWTNRIKVDYYTHSVSSKIEISLNEKIDVRFIKSPFSHPIFFKILLFFLFSSFIKIFKTFLSLFLGKWWNLLLLKEVFLYDVVNLNNGRGLALRYMFHNSKWVYRPLWTMAAEKYGSEIYFYFYSTNIERFKKINKKTNCVNFWHLITWPRILVWDEFQESFLNNNLIQKSNIEIVGPISFNSSKSSNLEINGKSIAIFDVQPVRTSYYITLGLDQEYYIPDVANRFLTDVFESVTEIGFRPVFKRKRSIGKYENSLYTQKLKLLSEKYQIVSIDPSIPPEQIIETSIATISMPFTSTSLTSRFLLKPSIFYDPTGLILKDDPAAHGILVINNKLDLKKWLCKLQNK